MPSSIISDLIGILLSKTWYEWIDEIVQFVATEVPSIFSECAQRVFSLLVGTISI